MKYIDISKSVYSGMKRYPSDPEVKIHSFKCTKKGNSCNLKTLTFGTHTGTHIDAPKHIFNKGKGVDKLKLKDLVCKTVVTRKNALSEKDFLAKSSLKGIKGILIKGRKNCSVLTVRDAKSLVKSQIKIVGTENMSIEDNPGKKQPVHKKLLKNGIIILENIKLNQVKEGCYTLICLPLKIRSGDGAPARAILLRGAWLK